MLVDLGQVTAPLSCILLIGTTGVMVLKLTQGIIVGVDEVACILETLCRQVVTAGFQSPLGGLYQRCAPHVLLRLGNDKPSISHARHLPQVFRMVDLIIGKAVFSLDTVPPTDLPQDPWFPHSSVGYKSDLCMVSCPITCSHPSMTLCLNSECS